MKNMKKTAAAGIALAAGAGLVAGPAMMAGQAWAAGEQNGSITINSDEQEGKVAYGAIQLFKADVAADAKLSNVEWATGAEEKVLPVLRDAGYDGSTAQEAVEFIAKHLGAETGTSAILADSELGMKIALAVKDLTAVNITEGTSTDLGEGYWVILTTTAAGTDLSGTSPIYAVIGPTAVTVNEKTSVPTLTKQIKEDSKTGAEAWGKEADHTLGQEIEYKLTGTVSKNLASFATYQYNFVDEMGAGLEFIADSVVVKSGDITFEKDTDYTVSYNTSANKLEVKFANLKGKVAGGATITCEYKAKQVTAAGDAGAENSAYVEYTHSPSNSELSKTKEDKAKDYSYALKITKTDNATGATITESAAKFTIKNTAGKYIGMKDGKIAEVETPYEFETVNGIIEISGIDADVYEIEETEAPTSYQKLAKPFQVTIDATDRAKVTKKITVDENTNKSQSTEDGITVPNVKDLGLPVTGEELGLIILCAGSGIVVLSGIGFVVNRARNRHED